MAPVPAATETRRGGNGGGVACGGSTAFAIGNAADAATLATSIAASRATVTTDVGRSRGS